MVDEDDFIEERDKRIMENVLSVFKSGDDISVPLIMRKCKTGYFATHRVFDRLKEEKKIQPGANAQAVSKFL